MELSPQEKKLVTDYLFFHLHSPLNSQPEDYRKFNGLLFRAFKLNMLYTVGVGWGCYRLLFKRNTGVFSGLVGPGKAALGLSVYCFIAFSNRLQNELYSAEALNYAQKYENQVEKYNSHFSRIYGNA